MKQESTYYLSDEELEQLIFTVEQQELVTAPPELLDKILKGVEESRESDRTPDNKVREFRSDCFRVLTSVAAAIVIVFLLPKLQNIQLPEVSVRQDMVVSGKYATKEEALMDKGILTEAFSGVNIFDNNNRFKIFSE